MSQRTRLIDLRGKQFGRLVVLDRDDREPTKRPRWLCACECGQAITTTGERLRNGQTTSCGCFHREQAAQLCRNRESTHGGSGSRLYRIWAHMLDRCGNPNNDAYRWYGAKGVTVRWDSFEAFRSWALANRYSESLSIDRLDSDGDYCETNCEWVTVSENTRRMQATKRAAA